MKHYLLISALALGACTPDPAAKTSTEETVIYRTERGSLFYVHTVHDAKHEVTCWITHYRSISCLPDKDVKR